MGKKFKVQKPEPKSRSLNPDSRSYIGPGPLKYQDRGSAVGPEKYLGPRF